jgi:hypothetical protein
MPAIFSRAKPDPVDLGAHQAVPGVSHRTKPFQRWFIGHARRMSVSGVSASGSPVSDRYHRAISAVLAAFCIATCLFGHAQRLRYASLFSDDLIRVGEVQTQPLEARLFRPFNEHVAPIFEVVTTVAWRLAGKRLAAAPLAFTVASYVPFVLILMLLSELVRQELGSRTTALAAVMIFGISSVDAEAIYWYSASSFSWALMWTLVVLICSGAASRLRKPLGWCGAALAAALAPACSAIGVIAGPLGTVRLLATGPARRGKSLLIALVPSAGTLVYMAIYFVFRPAEILAAEGERRVTIVAGLCAACRAPFEVLLPGLLGIRLDKSGLPLALILVLLIAGLLGVIWWARRSSCRHLIVCGVGLIVGGYGLTYLVRGHYGPYWLLQVERYHLFPQAGLTLIVVAALHVWLKRADRRPDLTSCTLIGLAALLLAVHARGLRDRAQRYRFPEQQRTLAAFDRLNQTCREIGITRCQALAALDPIRTRWYPNENNALAMLPASVKSAVVPDASVRTMLLAALSQTDLEALYGGMDASPYLSPASDFVVSHQAPLAVGQLVASFGVRPQGTTGQYLSAGGSAYLEFKLASEAGGPGRVLCISGGASTRPWEIWWTDARGRWDESRSARLKIGANRPELDWAIPLERLPHWGSVPSLRIRIFPRSKGQIAVGSPRLLR